MRIDELNAMSRESFVAEVGWAFEDSPWVAARAWDRRPFASAVALHAAMVGVVAAAGYEDQLALLRAHPDLGARARMSAASKGEQAGAGLDHLALEEHQALQKLNAEYRRKFDFPFLFAVRNASRHDILDALERRLTRSPEEEFAEALIQVYRIARFRIESMSLRS